MLAKVAITQIARRKGGKGSMEELPKGLREPSFVLASSVQKKWKKTPPKLRSDKSPNRRS